MNFASIEQLMNEGNNVLELCGYIHEVVIDDLHVLCMCSLEWHVQEGREGLRAS